MFKLSSVAIILLISSNVYANKVPTSSIAPTRLDSVDITQYCIFKNEIYTKGAIIKHADGRTQTCAEEKGSFTKINNRRVVNWVND